MSNGINYFKTYLNKLKQMPVGYEEAPVESTSVLFFLRGGQVVKLNHVTHIDVKTNPVTEQITGYTIEFEEKHTPGLAVFSVPDILAITSCAVDY